jgi:hypothetical protein
MYGDKSGRMLFLEGKLYMVSYVFSMVILASTSVIVVEM